MTTKIESHGFMYYMFRFYKYGAPLSRAREAAPLLMRKGEIMIAYKKEGGAKRKTAKEGRIILKVNEFHH